jgi:hypothetical protein
MPEGVIAEIGVEPRANRHQLQSEQRGETGNAREQTKRRGAAEARENRGAARGLAGHGGLNIDGRARNGHPGLDARGAFASAAPLRLSAAPSEQQRARQNCQCASSQTQIELGRRNWGNCQRKARNPAQQ